MLIIFHKHLNYGLELVHTSIVIQGVVNERISVLVRGVHCSMGVLFSTPCFGWSGNWLAYIDSNYQLLAVVLLSD